MKKKIFISAYSMELGGIETALINLLKSFNYDIYDVTLVLENKTGIFLNDIPENVNVLEYKVCHSKFVFYRKIYNRLKLLYWKFKIHNKFYFSCSFCTYSIPGSHLARSASSNSALWIHGNYYVLYGEKMKKFFSGLSVDKFKKIVFVSEENKNDICKHYPSILSKSTVCNNLIDGDLILKKSVEKINYKRNNDVLFVNIGRHEEHQKKLSRIINATKKLNDEGYKFNVLFVGDGPNHLEYQEKCKKLNLNNVLFVGKKKNPFPYYLISDAVILSSDYEGYPVVFLEAMILQKTILSTKISDWESLDNRYGIFCDLSDDGVYNNMKYFLDNKFKNKYKFDFYKYNDDILKKIEKIIEE